MPSTGEILHIFDSHDREVSYRDLMRACRQLGIGISKGIMRFDKGEFDRIAEFFSLDLTLESEREKRRSFKFHRVRFLRGIYRDSDEGGDSSLRLGSPGTGRSHRSPHDKRDQGHLFPSHPNVSDHLVGQ